MLVRRVTHQISIPDYKADVTNEVSGTDTPLVALVDFGHVYYQPGSCGMQRMCRGLNLRLLALLRVIYDDTLTNDPPCAYFGGSFVPLRYVPDSVECFRYFHS